MTRATLTMLVVLVTLASASAQQSTVPNSDWRGMARYEQRAQGAIEKANRSINRLRIMLGVQARSASPSEEKK
jgi:hypothetical protein